FSTRFMWRRHGEGEIYAYLPTSSKRATSIGHGNWRFQSDQWYLLEQEVILNDPGVANGQIRVWLDGKKVVEQGGLTFRQVSHLTIDGIYFSTFFGGGDPSWATPQDVYVDFANFSVSTVKTDE
ncbi:MAG: polysaccharide lyase, partial [Pleurocapsa sp.]